MVNPQGELAIRTLQTNTEHSPPEVLDHKDILEKKESSNVYILHP